MPKWKSHGYPSLPEGDYVLVTISLDTTTSPRGFSSVKIINGTPARGMIVPSSSGLSPSSIHSNFVRTLYTDWMTSSSDLLVANPSSNKQEGIWIQGTSSFYFEYNHGYGTNTPTTSEYSLLSFYAKTDAEFSLDIYPMRYVEVDQDPAEHDYYTVNITSKYWKRYDVLIPILSRDEAADIGDTEMHRIYFTLYGPSYKTLWLSEFNFVDSREESEKTNWIDMNINSEQKNHEANVVKGDVAGFYGDLVYSTQPDNRRGNVGFITHAPQDDVDILFIDKLRRTGTKAYLRSIGEGWPIYITNAPNTIKDTFFGSHRDIDIDFIEEEVERGNS